MHLYTFQIGHPVAGLHLRFSSWGWDLEQAIRDGRAQLQEQLDSHGDLRLNLNWGLMGALTLDLEQICEANLVAVKRDTILLNFSNEECEENHMPKAA